MKHMYTIILCYTFCVVLQTYSMEKNKQKFIITPETIDKTTQNNISTHVNDVIICGNKINLRRNEPLEGIFPMYQQMHKQNIEKLLNNEVFMATANNIFNTLMVSMTFSITFGVACDIEKYYPNNQKRIEEKWDYYKKVSTEMVWEICNNSCSNTFKYPNKSKEMGPKLFYKKLLVSNKDFDSEEHGDIYAGSMIAFFMLEQAQRNQKTKQTILEALGKR